MKHTQSFIKLAFVTVIVGVLGYFGLHVSNDQVEDVLDEVIETAGKQIEKTNPPEPIEVHEKRGPYEVASVIDGDTITAYIDGQKETVRLIGINAPETEYSSRGAECFGAEAMEFARTFLNNEMVYLETDPTQDSIDQYGRILAYVSFENGTDVGEVMLAKGFAYEFTYRDAYKHQAIYKHAEKTAKENGVGLWADTACQS